MTDRNQEKDKSNILNYTANEDIGRLPDRQIGLRIYIIIGIIIQPMHGYTTLHIKMLTYNMYFINMYFTYIHEYTSAYMSTYEHIIHTYNVL